MCYLVGHWERALPAASEHVLRDGQCQTVVRLDLSATRIAVHVPTELVQNHHQRRRGAGSHGGPSLQLAALCPMQEPRELAVDLFIYRRLCSCPSVPRALQLGF